MDSRTDDISLRKKGNIGKKGKGRFASRQDGQPKKVSGRQPTFSPTREERSHKRPGEERKGLPSYQKKFSEKYTANFHTSIQPGLVRRKISFARKGRRASSAHEREEGTR